MDRITVTHWFAKRVIIKKDKKIYYMIGVIILVANQPANAYIDPGTGAFVIQMLLAALAGSLFYIKQILYRIKKILGLIKPDEANNKTKPPDDTDNAEP